MVAALVAAALPILGPTGLLAFGVAGAQVGDAGANPLLVREDGTTSSGDEDEPAAGAGAVFPPDRERDYVQPAPSPLIPVLAQEAQRGSRAARLLVLDFTPSGLDAYLLRGAGIQEADLPGAKPVLRASMSATRASEELLTAAATLTAQPSSTVAQTLADHAVEVVMLTAQTQDFDAIQGVLDATSGLERIGNVDGATLWRVRPGGEKPARVTVVTETSEQIIVDSGQVTVDTQIDDVAGTLVLSEVADGNWQAWLDGEPLAAEADPGPGGWRQAFSLPAGGGHLRVTYDAPFL